MSGMIFRWGQVAGKGDGSTGMKIHHDVGDMLKYAYWVTQWLLSSWPVRFLIVERSPLCGVLSHSQVAGWPPCESVSFSDCLFFVTLWPSGRPVVRSSGRPVVGSFVRSFGWLVGFFSWLGMRCGDGGGRLGHFHDGPHEPAQFPRQRDLHFLSHHKASGQLFAFFIQPVLAFPGDDFHFPAVPGVNVFLTLSQSDADFGREPVVLGTFVDEPAEMAVAGFGEASLTPFPAAAGLGGHEAEVGHELPGMGKPVDAAQLGHGNHCRDQPESAQPHQGPHDGGLDPGCEQILHLFFQPGDALVGGINGLDIFLENDAHGGKGKGGFAQGAHAGFAPRGLVGPPVAVAQEEGFELAGGAAFVVHGVGAGAAEVADAFVGGVGNMHGGELPGAVQAGQHEGIATISFDFVALAFGDERWSGEEAGDAFFGQVPGEDEAGGAGFITDAQFLVGVTWFAQGTVSRARRSLGMRLWERISPSRALSAVAMLIDSAWTSSPI